MTRPYVHGYDPRENRRLQDKASTLVELLHSDTAYPAGSRVLEAGCGVGAQTVILAAHSPRAQITSIDISEASIAEARKAVEAAGFRNVTLQPADIFHLPFAPESFDHVFVCFVLEHLAQPVEALKRLKAVLKPGGTFTAMIEGVRQPALDAGPATAADFDQGVTDLYRTAEADGVFCYTFFKARAIKAAPTT
jgi:ubiquinone/menaquinone biosynthesis C-methylase UbiE